MKKFLIILLIIFICGILSADVCLKQIEDSNVLMGLDFYKKFANAKLAFKDVFWNICYERFKLFGVLILVYFTPIKERISIIILPIFSFIWGFFLMSCIIELGVAGLVVGLASVIPHGGIYGAAIVMILSKRRVKGYHKRSNLVTNTILYMLLAMLFMTGCVIECLMSVHFLPWVIRLSMV